MNPPIARDARGRIWHLSETTLDTVELMLKATHVPTKLRLGYLLACLFRSSTPVGERLGPVLIDWDEVMHCNHGNPLRLISMGADECGCRAQWLPPTTAEAVRDFIRVMNAVVAAHNALDWTLPARETAQDLAYGNKPNASLVGEVLAQFEHSWKTLIMRVPGGAGPHGALGPAPSWWTDGLRMQAQKANAAWLIALKGSGARGALPLAPDLDSCDDVFNSTGWLLQYHRLPELQSELARTPVGVQIKIFFDTEGTLRAVPDGGFTTPGAPTRATDGVRPASGGSSGPSGVASGAASGGPSGVASGVASGGASGGLSGGLSRGGARGSAAAEHGAFAVGQHVELSGLSARPDLNGQVGEVLAPGKTGGRYPIRVGGASVLIKEENLRRTARSTLESKIVNGFVMVCGEWFPMPRFLELSMRASEAACKMFAALDKEVQADVLAGRQEMLPPPPEGSGLVNLS